MKNKSQYKSLSEWKKACPKDYDLAYRNGHLDAICEHFGWSKIKKRDMTKSKPRGYWKIKENVLAEAKKYKNTYQWLKGNGGSYMSARENGWMEEATAHMNLQKPKGYWTKERILEEAKKYKTVRDWNRESSSSCDMARRRGWFDEASAHMVLPYEIYDDAIKPMGYWQNKENVLKSAIECRTYVEWYEKYPRAVEMARVNGWKEECSEHFERKNKPAGHWDVKENVIEEAKKYKTRVEWKRGNSASYNKALNNKWMTECTKHMGKKFKRGSETRKYKWTKDKCAKEAKKYMSRTEWAKNSSGSYSSSKKNGWMDELTKHMGWYKHKKKK